MNTRLPIFMLCLVTCANNMTQMQSPRNLTPSLLDAQGNINLAYIDLSTLNTPLYAQTIAYEALTAEIEKLTQETNRKEQERIEKVQQAALRQQELIQKEQARLAMLQQLENTRLEQIKRQKEEELKQKALREEMLTAQQEHDENQELCNVLATKPNNFFAPALTIDTCSIDTTSSTHSSPCTTSTTSPIINDEGNIDYLNIDLASITTPLTCVTQAHQALVEEIEKRKSPQTPKTMGCDSPLTTETVNHLLEIITEESPKPVVRQWQRGQSPDCKNPSWLNMNKKRYKKVQ